MLLNFRLCFKMPRHSLFLQSYNSVSRSEIVLLCFMSKLTNLDKMHSLNYKHISLSFPQNIYRSYRFLTLSNPHFFPSNFFLFIFLYIICSSFPIFLLYLSFYFYIINHNTYNIYTFSKSQRANKNSG